MEGRSDQGIGLDPGLGLGLGQCDGGPEESGTRDTRGGGGNENLH